MWAPPLFLAIVVGAVLLSTRSGRPSWRLHAETRTVQAMFAGTIRDDLGFRGPQAQVVFEDMRLDRNAPGEFGETQCPVSVVRIAVNPFGVHFLWAYSDTLARTPQVTRLDKEQAREALRQQGSLLQRTFPKSAVRIAGRTGRGRLRGS